jgi:hypothetical protein
MSSYRIASAGSGEDLTSPKAKYGRLGISDARRPREFEQENRR